MDRTYESALLPIHMGPYIPTHIGRSYKPAQACRVASSSLSCVLQGVCCSVLQCVAVCCSVLQCQMALSLSSVCCSMLQAAVCCSVLEHAGLCLSVSECVAVCCSVLHKNTHTHSHTHTYTHSHTNTMTGISDEALRILLLVLHHEMLLRLFKFCLFV